MELAIESIYIIIQDVKTFYDENYTCHICFSYKHDIFDICNNNK